jgi:hypothetical protein
MKAISKMLLIVGSGIGLLIVGLGYEAIEHRTVNAQSANISIAGEWTSTEGRIAFVQSGSNISGAYEMQEGLIDGKLSGNVLTGYWSQARSILAVRCDTPRKGRYAWE